MDRLAELVTEAFLLSVEITSCLAPVVVDNGILAFVKE